MKRGVIISAVLHVLVIGVAYFGLPILFDPPKIETSPPMAIDIVVPEEKPQKPKPKPVPPTKPEPAPEPIKRTQPLPPLVPAPTPLVNPVPAPKATPPLPKAKPKPKPKKVEKPKRKKLKRVVRVAPKPMRKPPPPDELQFRRILKDLTKRKKSAPKLAQKPSRIIKPKPTAVQPAFARRKVENDLSMKVRQQIVPCWNIPGGLKDAQKMKISIRIRLKRDGSLLGLPRVVDTVRFRSDGLFKVMAESAVRALLNPGCSPLRLPHGDYDIWKDITFNFDPSEALGP